MKTAVILVGAFTSLSAASQELPDSPQEPSVEILGVTIVRGMPEAEVRALFPSVYCAGKAPGVDPSFDHCSVSDDVPPGADGEVTFKDGVVYNATRNWFIPEDAEPLEVLMMLNDILTRLIGEKHAACGKIETYSNEEPSYTFFDLPEKVLTVQMHIVPGRSGAYFKESLRVNPVPDSYKTRGDKMQGTEWCGYVN
jgi:hypothetical protein